MVLAVPCELTTGQLAPLLADCADRAEQLRRSGARVVLVTGCELTLYAAGFLPGGTVFERIESLQSVTYASGMWEPVDWGPFDIAVTDAYRDASNAGEFRAELRRLLGRGALAQASCRRASSTAR